MINLISPLNLKTRLKRPDYKMDALPLLDVLFIAFMLSLVGSHFVFSPGITLDLPQAPQHLLAGQQSTAILTVKQGNMLFYEGNIYNIETLEPVLRDTLLKANDLHPVLLVKMGQSSETRTLFKICEMAKKVGFAHVQIASNVHNASPNAPLGPF